MMHRIPSFRSANRTREHGDPERPVYSRHTTQVGSTERSLYSRHSTDIGETLERHHTIDDAASLATIDRPPEPKSLNSTNNEKSQSLDGRPVLSRRTTELDVDVGETLERHRTVDDAASLATIDRPPSEEDMLPPSKIYHPLSFPVLVLLAPASVFGVLARLGIQALTTYDGQSIFSLAWVQFMGCLIMGFGLGIREPFGQFYAPLYTAMTTGFCGSLTTFSGWQLDVFEAWINTGFDHRDWFRDVIDGFTQLFFTLALALAAISFGNHCASLLTPHLPTLSLPPRKVRYSLSALAVLVYAAAYPAYFRMSPAFRHQATAALLFSFPGTLTRYLLSIQLNPRLHLFPLGTFTANMFGTAVLGALQVLRNIHTPPSRNACDVLQGIADGYCGCLTTVSTFAVEVSALQVHKKWFYVIISWVGAQCLLILIVGASVWTGSVSKQPTCVFS